MSIRNESLRTRAVPGRLATVIRSLFVSAMLMSLPAAPSLAWEPVESEADAAAEKEFWQGRYRNLLNEAARLRALIEREQELYADANRRNYRRGKKRHVHRDAMLAAQADLAEVEAKLEVFPDEARRAGALPGWLYEVEDEVASRSGSPPAAAPDLDEAREKSAGQDPR